MPVGIAEIDAFAATRPFRAPLNFDAMRGKTRLPIRKLLTADRKRDMQRAVAIMRRDGTARHAHGFKRKATPEHEQHALAAHIIGAEPRVARELLQAEHIAVEARSALEVVHIERGLEHAVELGRDS